MKVYQVNVVCGNGSTGKIAVDISNQIEKHGGQCRIAYGRGAAPQGVDAVCIAQKLEVYYHAFMARLWDRCGLYSKKATQFLIEDIKKYHPDIIQLHNIHGYYVNYEMLFTFLKEYKRPVVWTLHDCWAFTGHCAHFDHCGCNQWENACENCPQKSEYPKAMLKDNSKENYLKKKELFTNVDDMTIVTVSDWLCGIVRKSFLRNYSIKTIYNGIDLEKIRPIESELRKQYNLEKKKVILGVASVWNEKKGIKTFMKLAEKVSSDMQIVLIRVPEKIKKQLPKNILCIDNVEGMEELTKWYSLADVYVNGSVEETMGLTTIEALATGTPVVVMNATACPELVTKECGRVVEKGDIDALVRAIDELLEEKELFYKCQNRASEFEKSKQYEQYYTLYEGML